MARASAITMGPARNSTSASFNAAAYLAGMTATIHGRAAGVPASGFGMVSSSSIRNAGSRRRPTCGQAPRGPPSLAAGNVWMRGILEEHYGAPHREITWLVEREDASVRAAAGLRYERVPDGVRAEKMMLDGKLDGLLSPDLPHAFLKGDPRHRAPVCRQQGGGDRLLQEDRHLPDHARDLDKRELVERHPWLPNTLMKAFNQAKEIAYRVSSTRATSRSPGCATRSRSRIAILGPDPWEFGLTDKNRKNLETLQHYCAQQGIVRQERPLEELFIDAGRVNIPEEV